MKIFHFEAFLCYFKQTQLNFSLFKLFYNDISNFSTLNHSLLKSDLVFKTDFYHVHGRGVPYIHEYSLEPDLATIKQYIFNEWKEKVPVAVWKRNKQKLLDNCVVMNNDVAKVLTKTKHIHNALTNTKYNGPLNCIIGTNKQRARTIVLSQNGMLECGKNMKGTIPEI